MICYSFVLCAALSFDGVHYIALIFLCHFSFIPLFSVGGVWGVVFRLNQKSGGGQV